MKVRWIAAVVLTGLASLPAQALEVLSKPDVQAVLAADAQSSGPQPYRFAVPLAAAFTPGKSGEWSVAENGQAQWRLEIMAPEATSLNLRIDRLQLPASARLTITGLRDGEQRGPYTAAEGIDGQLWTPVVQGDALRIDVLVDPAQRLNMDFIVAQVNYGFRGFGAPEVTAKSGACNVDVACEVAEGWENEIRSVARISIQGLFLCTGQLMNNTAEDFKPYFLTAAHCLSTEAEASGTLFYFNYETSTCGGTPDGQLEQVISGSSLVATSGAQGPDLGPDFTLLLMNEAPPEEFRPYYSGWDNRDLAPEGVTAIHHPSGDEKRISFEFDPTHVAWYGEEPGSVLSELLPTHLKIDDWDIGTTEGGSSGSGIWNSDHHLVGQLSGGSAACGNDLPDWYGRFHMNWYFLESEQTSLATYLDPLGIGAETLDGADPFAEPAEGAPELRATPAAGGKAGAPAMWLLVMLAIGRFARRSK